jgi:hypothetical protein
VHSALLALHEARQRSLAVLRQQDVAGASDLSRSRQFCEVLELVRGLVAAVPKLLFFRQIE